MYPMLRWCSYCQRLIGEVAPLASIEVTHGACGQCARRLEAGEPLIPEYHDRVQFYRELFSAALAGDEKSCEALIVRSRDAGLGREELLIGLLQPALMEIGKLWEAGSVTPAHEQRFTAWCNSRLDRVATPPSEPPLDLLLLQAPDNLHTVGVRVAEQVLSGRGLRCRAVQAPLGAAEIMQLCAEHQPAWLGFSCALPQMVEASLALHTSLVASGHHGRTIVSGQAVRRHPEAWRGRGVLVCPTLADALSVLQAR